MSITKTHALQKIEHARSDISAKEWYGESVALKGALEIAPNIGYQFPMEAAIRQIRSLNIFN